MPPSTFPRGAPPGWRPDPQVPGRERWWDGTHWTARVRGEGVREITTRADLREAIADGLAAGRAGTHRLAVAAQTGQLVVAGVCLVALVLEVAAWNRHSTDTLDDPGAVDVLREATTGSSGLLVATTLGVVVVSALVVSAWLVAVRRHHLTERPLLHHPLVVDVVGLLVAVVLPVVGPVFAGRVLTQHWHATRPFSLRDRHTPPPSVVAWTLLLVGAQLVPAALVVTGVVTAADDLLGWTTLAAIALALLGATTALALVVVVRSCDAHFDGRLA